MSFIDQYVVQVYDKIATHFNDTRAYTWDSVEKFVKSLTSYSSLVEIGCGNGKNLLIRDDLIRVGMDISQEMTKITKNKSIDCGLGDCQWLPFKTNSFDASISIAVNHHLDCPNKRLQALGEQIRITKPGGKILLQVWSTSAVKKYKGDKFTPLENGSPGDYLVKWQKLDGMKLYRYYHLFSGLEFMSMINHYKEKYSQLTILEECNNWLAIITLI